MRIAKRITLAVLMVLAAGAVVRAGEPDAQALIKELRGEGEPVKRTPAEYEAAYATAVAALLPDMGAEDVGKRGGAQDTLEKMTHQAGRPGNEVQAAALSKALAAKIGPDSPALARVWMLRMLQHIGRAECVPAVAAILADKEADVRESARRTLQKNPSDEAGTALRAALDKASDPAWRVAMINAVADRRDAAATAAFLKALGDADADVAIAGARALGKVGGPAAAKALADARKKAPEKARPAVVDALLLAADGMVAAGKKDDAAAIYTSLYVPDEPKAIRIAALRGLIASTGPKAVALLADILAGDDAQMQVIAVDLTRDLPGADATRTLAALLPKVSASGKVALLGALAARGDAAAKPAVLEAMKADDEAVRAAAVVAMGAVGDASDVPTLAKMAAGAPEKEQAAAVGALARLGGKDTDAAIVKAIGGADAPAKVALLRALAARKAESVAPDVAEVAADADPAVKTEALATLGVIGTPQTLPALVGLLAKADADAPRQAAEKSIVAIVNRTPEAAKAACADPVIAGLSGAGAPVRAALLRTLCRIGGPKALEAARAGAKDADDSVKDAAIRTLADWPDDAPVADLLAIAKSDAKQTHQVLALRGYVRLVGKSARPNTEKVKMYEEAMAAAKRPDEKKMVLAGMADAPSIETLEMVKKSLTDEALKAEAVAAAVKIAAAIAGGYREEARTTLEGLIDQVQGDLRRQAQEALNLLEKDEDFVTVWMVSGPYMEKEKDGAALFDIEFPPEKGDGSEAKWKAVGANNGQLDMGAITEAGDQRAAYLRTYILSPKAQEARLDMGSDDGIKVWLNGKVVHANNANRGYQANQDRAKIALNEGTNVLLVKITNGGDGWQAGVRVRAADGGKLAGLKFRPTAN